MTSADGTRLRVWGQGLFAAIGAADDHGEDAEIAGGDHFVFHSSRRFALYDAVYGFQQRY